MATATRARKGKARATDINDNNVIIDSSPTEGTADGWPSWCDAHTWELGPADAPSDADRAYWAEQSPDYHTDEPSPAELLSEAAWDYYSRSLWEVEHPDGC